MKEKDYKKILSFYTYTKYVCKDFEEGTIYSQTKNDCVCETFIVLTSKTNFMSILTASGVVINLNDKILYCCNKKFRKSVKIDHSTKTLLESYYNSKNDEEKNNIIKQLRASSEIISIDVFKELLKNKIAEEFPEEKISSTFFLFSVNREKAILKNNFKEIEKYLGTAYDYPEKETSLGNYYNAHKDIHKLNRKNMKTDDYAYDIIELFCANCKKVFVCCGRCQIEKNILKLNEKFVFEVSEQLKIKKLKK